MRDELKRIAAMSDERKSEITTTLEYLWTEKGGGYLKPAYDGWTGKRYVQEWPMGTELCDVCGQPDNCGDCNHTPLTHTEVEHLGGWFVPLDNE